MNMRFVISSFLLSEGPEKLHSCLSAKAARLWQDPEMRKPALSQSYCSAKAGEFRLINLLLKVASGRGGARIRAKSG